jgi:ATP-dependent RNA helicase DeaD
VVEHDAKDTSSKETTGVTRGQNVLYVLPHDEDAIAQFLGPALGRLDAAIAETQLLAVTADAESAAALSAATARVAADTALVAVPATSARRAERLLKAGPAHVVTGTARELLALVRAAALKLEPVRVLVLAWADQLAEAGDTEALETLLADVPKTAARVIVTSEMTPEVEALVERYARRARRVGGETEGEATPTTIAYATVSTLSRPPP